ncbi:MAG TPA: acyltransferase, partial [Ilumatobacteraceae bacterium]
MTDTRQVVVTATAPGPARHARRRDIEGLRAIALISVLLYHAGVRSTAGGFVGVDAFFVISGFLIIGLLWRELSSTGTVSLGEFYARRARRLLPAAVLVIVATVMVSWKVLPPLRSQSVARDGLASTFYVVNHRLAGGGTDYLNSSAAPSPLQHYWSLSVEEQFYLLVPVVMIIAWTVCRRQQRDVVARPSRTSALSALALVGGVSFIACIRLTSTAQRFAFFLLPTRAWEFVVGGLVAIGAPRLRHVDRRTGQALATVGIAAFIWSVTSYSAATSFPGFAALSPVLGVAGVIAAGCTAMGSAVNRVLGVTPLTAIGRISYSWYLWHWPILILVPYVIGHTVSTTGNVVLILLAGGLAAVTTYLVEDPVRFSPRLVGSARRTFAVGLSLSATAVLSIGVVVYEAGRLPNAPVAAAAPSLHVSRSAAATIPPTTLHPTTSSSAAAAQSASPTTTLPPTATVDPVAAALASASTEEEAAIAAAAGTNEVPANLTPTLSRAHADKAVPFADGCFANFRDTAIRSCSYGDVNAATRV